MASGSQEGGKRGSFQHDEHNHCHQKNSNANSSNNHSLNDSTTTNETVENQVLEMTNTRDGETNLNGNPSNCNAHHHHNNSNHQHHIITPNEDAIIDPNHNTNNISL